MSERLSIAKSELENPGKVFDDIAAARLGAQAHRAAYLESVSEMNGLCEQLRGVELLITGSLHGRGGTRVYRDDPKSQVDRLHVRVGSAKVDTYEGHGDLITRHTPFIDIMAWTVEANELVCAQLGIGDFGVVAEVVETAPIRT